MVADARLPRKHHRVELVHESLLTHWPRLVRWRTEEIGGGSSVTSCVRQRRYGNSTNDLRAISGAVRHSASTSLWRERYPGGLTALEEEFTSAMIVKARSHQTRFLTAVAATIVLLVSGIILIGFYWKQSELSVPRS